METKKVRCAQFVWQGYHKQNCARTGLYEDEGKHYCKQHHPPSQIAKADARNAVWAAEREEKEARLAESEAARKEMGRRAACYDDLLLALEAVVADMTNNKKPCGHKFTCACALINARAAIAKARRRE